VKVGKREEKEAKRGEGRKKEELGGKKERRINSTYFLFHQSLPPLEYKAYLIA
jgi:hypothetical protein